VRDGSLWRGLLGVEKTVIERVEFDEDTERLVAHVRPIEREWWVANPAARAPVGGSRCRAEIPRTRSVGTTGPARGPGRPAPPGRARVVVR